MTKKERQAIADRLDKIEQEIDDLTTELQAAFDDLSEPRQEGAEGEALQAHIDNLELTKNTVSNTAAHLRT
jgi:prefoldin subunit 5